MNRSLQAILIGLGLLSGSLGFAARAVNTRSVSPAPPPPIFVGVVSGEGEPEMKMDAVVMIQSGKFKAPYAEESEAAQQKFGKEYFAAGRKYRVLFDGGEVGSAIVKDFNTGCNNIHATVAVESSAKIHGPVRALVTNSETLGKRASARRSPSDSERAAVMELVKKIYMQRGVTAAQYRSLKVTNLTATDLNGDGKYEMIGSFTLALKNKAERDLFLIATAQEAGMRAEFAKFQAYQPPPEGFLSSIDFADQLDLDGDGIGEVFAVQGGFDGYGYVIFEKTGKIWREVFSAAGDAC